MADQDPKKHLPPEPPPHSSADAGEHSPKITVFYVVIAAVAVGVFAISLMDPLAFVLKQFLSILSPVIIGCVIAYLCDPILEFFEYRIFRRMKRGGLRRGLSLLCTVITALSVVILIALTIIPQLYRSLTDLIQNFPTHLGQLEAWLEKAVSRLPGEWDVEAVIRLLNRIFVSTEDSVADAFDWVQFLTGGDIGTKLWTFLVSFFSSFMDVFVGIFIAFYILASKEKRIAQIRKFRRAVFNDSYNKNIDDFLGLTDRTFGGFVFGKILDSMVIGILTFVLLTIFDISEYNILIASFIGITNIIPVFGPFIGAVPSFLIVLISSPSKAFLFLILVLIIQQIDSNIIAPKILGDNAGISSLCVIVAIAICGSLWGVSGILLGVPLFAVVIEIIKRYLERRLQAKGAPTDTTAYYPDDAVGDAEADVYYEHASLRYKYEHSRAKVKIDRLRTKLLRSQNPKKTHLKKQDEPVKTATESSETSEKDSPDPPSQNA